VAHLWKLFTERCRRGRNDLTLHLLNKILLHAAEGTECRVVSTSTEDDSGMRGGVGKCRVVFTHTDDDSATRDDCSGFSRCVYNDWRRFCRMVHSESPDNELGNAWAQM
jgi:hypothetical protein